MRMLTYFINRTGRRLSASRRVELQKAKTLLPSGWTETKNPEAEKRPPDALLQRRQSPGAALISFILPALS